MFKLALGAGHGANTPGKRIPKALDPNETREWWLNDRIADEVEALLSKYEGIQILRLDDSDDGLWDVALADRVAQANNWFADLYLSIHHNAGINGGTGGGIVAYTHPKSSKTSVEWRDALYDALVEATGLRGNRANPKATSNLYVLRKTAMPAVLLELSFMDSVTDVPIILTAEYAHQCAVAIADTIVRREGLKLREDKSVVLDSSGAFTVKIPASKFALWLVDKDKRKVTGVNYSNAGYFGPYKEGKAEFTLPAGHTVADWMGEEPITKSYCDTYTAWVRKNRFSVPGGKVAMDGGSFASAPQFYGKAVSTLIVREGKAEIRELAALPVCDYAVSGLPVLRDRKAVSWAACKAQGWDASPVRKNTWHKFIGLKGDGYIYLMRRYSKTSNLISSGEAAKMFPGFRDVIKLDGGGSDYARISGKACTTGGSRRISTVITWDGNPWPVPTRTLKKGKKGDDVKWLQYQLRELGYELYIDGSFGPATLAVVKRFQEAMGLAVDGSVGPATRRVLGA